ncbi:MAG: NHLP family bacteriocin export ABC transporter peptidase/permease/ATPase subunit [Betaproteobacteria bacterium RIFCSPLOWO2_12_FULL_65_14]|nr:MAG: NHLP family bacteriocin export ABC transporter peptidase/permease/ATPase subunit [Betaproteobacteria bacterium RIFCSPLOWO2_12_FULL_65_14]
MTRATRRRRTPSVLQMEALECGAASLAMILGYYKRWVPLEELRLRCGVSRDGSKASNVLKAARGYGMTGKGYKKEPAELRNLPLPCIVFWNFNHFLVVEGFGRGKVFLNDPASGPRVVSDAEFDQSFTGVVLVIEPGRDFAPGGQKPSVVEALKRRFVGLHAAVSYLVLVGLALVAPGMVVPVFSSTFIDKFFVSGLQSWLKPLLIGMVVTALLRAALTWLQGWYLLRTQTRIALSSASKFFWHVLRLPAEFYTQRSAGEIGARVALNDRVATLLSGDLAKAVLNAATAVFFACVMLFYDVTLTLVSIAVVGANFVALLAIARRMREMSEKLSLAGGKLLGTSMNGLRMIETLKSSGGEAAFFNHIAGHQAIFVNAQQDAARVALVLGSLPGLLTAVNAAVVLGVGGVLVIDGRLSIGMLVAFQSLVASFTRPVTALADLGSRLQEAQGDMNRLDDVMRCPTDSWTDRSGGLPEAGAAGSANRAKLEGFIELRGIRFGYSRTDPALINGFDLSLRPGQRVAIVGRSGCGKSTLSRIVMGLYAPWEGEVLFDGQPREAYGRYEFANSVAMVEQEVALFEGTVRDNLTLWDDSITDADVVQAAKDACIHDVILGRAGGYDGVLEEQGRNLSGGQRQRIEIARALSGNPRVLVLDEATSALDATTERLIDENIRRRGCTCIVVSHRLSTIRDCDEIIVLDHGKIVERGAHDQLVAKPDGAYLRLIADE